MHFQRGLSLSGFMFVAVLVVAGVLLVFKLSPAYFEYYRIQRQFKVMADEPSLKAGSRGEILQAFSNRANIDQITVISPNDLDITKNGNSIVISAAYSVRVPLVGNLSACIDFNPTSEK